MTTDNRLWRVTRAGRGDGDAVELEVRGDDSEHVTTWLLSYGDGWDRVQARTAREAVATWVVLAGFAPTAAEILAPGEPSRAELAARSTAAEARVAELLSDRADAAEVLVTEVERAQTAERRVTELTRERDASLVRAVDIADAVEAEAHEERARIVVQASRSLMDLARCEGHAMGANRITCALRDLLNGSNHAATAYTAPLREQVVARTRERDAALAAVDAVRADYAPRREPPTADEVRAVSRLWGRDHAARCVAWRSDEHGRWSESWNTGGFAVEVKASPNAAYMLFGPTGPVAWSELAALVRGGDRG